MPRTLLATAERHAAALGLNLFGLVDAERFDASQPKDQRIGSRWPGYGSVVVVGSGGGEFWQQFAKACGAVAGTNNPPAMVAPTAVQHFASHCVREVAACFHPKPLRFLVVEPTGPCPSLLRLGEAAGLGTISPVSGLLLHPEYGPWVSLRAALLFEGHPFGPIPDASLVEQFQPCCSCRQPCLNACNGSGSCPAECRGRCGCPVGSQHRTPLTEAKDCSPALLRSLGFLRWLGRGRS